VRLVLSGPASGVVGAREIGAAGGFRNLLTFDMGGTSTDVALLDDAELRLAPEAVVHGYPIKAPMLDIHTVGAGGGSIAQVDSGGLLKVGPRSAGADPGPACYGRGSALATVTDANVALGFLPPDALLGGRMPIRRDLSLSAIGALGAQLGLGTMATAEGILRIVTANMAKALRVVSQRHAGQDPRDYTLMAFGGAGPLHAARLAEEMEIRTVLVPERPGILCAMGLLLTDIRTDFAATRLLRLDAPGTAEALAGLLAGLERQAAAWFEAEGVARGRRATAASLDMRYAGQNYELNIRLPAGGAVELGGLGAAFAAAHEARYGFVAAEEPVQVVTARLEATGRIERPPLRPLPAPPHEAAASRSGERQVWLGGAFRAVPLHDRSRLAPGARLPGPAIIEQMDSTTVVPPGWTARVDGLRSLVLEREAA
jgi:N-methylhydantoinase A